MERSVKAVSVTPDGMPIVVALMLSGVLALAIWDATRNKGEPWFKWLLPISYCVMVTSAISGVYPLMFLACLSGAMGLGLTNYWRWQKKRPGS
ncbi:hypothetical protein [Streptomyces niveiscabiei]|uniref:Integral membrane protein n=1 Tax=Streptomyces niveiscabiei TaxID=164115 RepID=A0ABW9I8Z7_9ACTN